jgi:predicted SprT family Zn-dependent metalloprotease
MKPPQDMIWLIGISSKGQNWNKLMKEIHNLRKNNTERERERERERANYQTAQSQFHDFIHQEEHQID